MADRAQRVEGKAEEMKGRVKRAAGAATDPGRRLAAREIAHEDAVLDDRHGLGGDAHAAFSQSLDKLAVRIRRYKRRLKSHTPAERAKEAETAALMVLRAPDAESEDVDGWSDTGGESPPSAMIIAETETALRTMTVSMAVLELDLIETQTIVFRNAAHGGLSVVYRRSDGNIGWIDPSER